MTKRIIALVAMLAVGAGMAMAAQQRGRMGQKEKMGQKARMGRMNVDQQVAQMKAHLNLSDQQAAQVKELFEKQNQERLAWRQGNPNPTRQDMRAHRMEMMRARTEGLKKILTPEQFAKHEEMRRQGRKRGPKGPPQP